MIQIQIKRLRTIDRLIKSERSGNAQELADKIGISRKQVYNYINELKEIGVNIEYCRNKRSFVYNEPYEFLFNLRIKKLSNNEMIDILGGKKNLLKKCNAITQMHNSFVSSSSFKTKMRIGDDRN